MVASVSFFDQNIHYYVNILTIFSNLRYNKV